MNWEPRSAIVMTAPTIGPILEPVAENEKALKLEKKIDNLKDLYVTWFIEKMALDHYYKTGSM